MRPDELPVDEQPSPLERLAPDRELEHGAALLIRTEAIGQPPKGRDYDAPDCPRCAEAEGRPVSRDDPDDLALLADFRGKLLTALEAIPGVEGFAVYVHEPGHIEIEVPFDPTGDEMCPTAMKLVLTLA